MYTIKLVKLCRALAYPDDGCSNRSLIPFLGERLWRDIIQWITRTLMSFNTVR
jgi:hypothetical protein